MIGRTLLAVLASAAPANASDRVGVVVAGDAALQAPIRADIASWLQRQGHQVEAAPLPGTAINHFLDCFVLEDAECARKIVASQASSDAIVYARVEASGSGPSRTVTITAHWIGKQGEMGTQKTACESCTDEVLDITLDAVLSSLTAASSKAASEAGASAATSTATGIETTAPDSAPAKQTGLAVGVEVGEPTSATVGWFGERLAVAAAVGTGTFEGPGVSVHADAQMLVTRLRPELPLRVGLGARFYHHGYQPMSIDEIPHEHVGLRVPATLAYERGPLQLYAELAPGIDVVRTASCTLADGPRSVCPHAQSSPFFIQLAVGARWFLSH